MRNASDVLKTMDERHCNSSSRPAWVGSLLSLSMAFGGGFCRGQACQKFLHAICGDESSAAEGEGLEPSMSDQLIKRCAANSQGIAGLAR